MNSPLTQILADSFSSNSDKLCVVDLDSTDESNRVELTYKQVQDAAGALIFKLDMLGKKSDGLKIGIVARNSANWVIADIACLFGGYTAVPLPMAFSRTQAENLAATCDMFLVDTAGAKTLAERWKIVRDPAHLIYLDTAARLEGATLPRPLDPDGICKVIHTSGTTSQPKGVKITIAALQQTLGSLCRAMPIETHKRYLSMVPLSLLLEQVTAIYLPLLDGGTVHFLPEACPILGEPGACVDELIARLLRVRPSAMTVPPMVIERIAEHINEPNKHLQEVMDYLTHRVLITCGGATVSSEILLSLASRGIHVYQGYGLSENTSVVSVNTAKNQRIGSVGKPLEHVRVRIAADRSIQILSSSLFSGYVWTDPSSCSFTDDGWLDTGDLGRLDEDGFLYVIGRKKNVLCLPNGRNVSPEQVEVELSNFPGVREAVVFLHHIDGLVALIISEPALNIDDLSQWMETVFSDIERPAVLWPVPVGSNLYMELFTANCRPKRGEITATYLLRRPPPLPEISK